MTTLTPSLVTASLPPLDRQVLELIAEGHRDPEVAARLGLGTVTRVRSRLDQIARHFGLEAAVRPQLVHHGYACGAVPPPPVLQPLVLDADAFDLVRALAAGTALTAYARRRGMASYQATYLMEKTSVRLKATTRPSVIRRAWQRQILGPRPFAADLAALHAQRPRPPETGRWLIVPLLSGYRLAAPATRHSPTRHLDITDREEALVAARFLADREGYAPLWITQPTQPGHPYRVSWGRRTAAVQPRHSPAAEPVLGANRLRSA
ncbi:hypothetical protein ABT117_15625 [Streptomyces sp. NPDC002262]|uniref:hypothetical protein n=1 Tax=Streptomyces sp. NPDC002262 TaxID=3154414 RepID=UPI003320D4A4